MTRCKATEQHRGSKFNIYLYHFLLSELSDVLSVMKCVIYTVFNLHSVLECISLNAQLMHRY